MNQEKIRKHTRYAYLCIALMLLAFAVFIALSLWPSENGAASRLLFARMVLYVLLFFAVLGGIFSVRVAWLRKQKP
ncbi:hypothetical protein [Neisseria weaveri]|uniref:Uncharacterized protein n=1 Tax=Neisseria weaveri TaxID=28091 RepID=A0A448VQ56_9NEIS|nr:hypothetical protein [Neisseria weaveri]EGV35553.1 hypothetical protein l13_15700 [Neisseria weaveri ATCC 51223]EGV37696.1 hypothetical protein l11_09370 [Neisseria weaveri LMG 5135]SAY50511.1 Uncharacterised protein [Neisseria weaveri]VEJ51920.1 Uncharacterised protein [Neisseria weaveri]